MTFTRSNLNTMSPEQLAQSIATTVGIDPPTVAITGTTLEISGVGVTETNRAKVQAVIDSYVYVPPTSPLDKLRSELAAAKSLPDLKAVVSDVIDALEKR